jgi:hypothetical protein
VALLDWCARFERSALSPAPAGGATFYVTNRAGRRASGALGLAQLAEAIPLLFPLWLPLALYAKLTASQRTQTMISSA